MMKLLVVLGLLGVTSLFADYQLTLIDKDGNQTDECVKSYSFSNNLESIARAKGVLKDVYSEEEVMTNKVYFGKPVYRRVLLLEDFTVPYGNIHVDKYSSTVDDIDEIIKNDFSAEINGTVITSASSKYVMYTDGHTQIILVSFNKSKKQARITLKQYHMTLKDDWKVSKFKFIVEYTKTTDKADTSSDTFKSYLHYTPSSSTTSELVSVDLKEMGVRILEDYTYDSSTNSCTKN